MIEAEHTTLLKQASMTAAEYLFHAIEAIDNNLGNGYAAKHPELIAAFMNTSALDFGVAVLAKEMGEAIHLVTGEIGGISG